MFENLDDKDYCNKNCKTCYFSICCEDAIFDSIEDVLYPDRHIMKKMFLGLLLLFLVAACFGEVKVRRDVSGKTIVDVYWNTMYMRCDWL